MAQLPERVTLEAHQWEKEWQDEVKCTSLDKNDYGSMGYLDQFHVFVLSNVLRRPVFLYSPPKLLSQDEGITLQNVDFHGLYLPLLWNPRNCVKNPLPIVYYNGHFSALSIIDNRAEYTDGCLLFPLCDYYHQDLPVRFMMEGEFPYRLKMDYLNTGHVDDATRRMVLCAKLELTEQPKYMKPLLSGFIDCCLEAYRKRVGVAKEEASASESVPCRKRCGFTGSSMYDGYCSKCYKALGLGGNSRPASEPYYGRQGSSDPYQRQKPASEPYQRSSDPYQRSSDLYQRPSDPYQGWGGGASDRRHQGGSHHEHFDQKDELEVSTVLCNNNCNRLGFATYLGMCKDCFEAKQKASSSSQSPMPRLPPPSSPAPALPQSPPVSSLLQKSAETRPCRAKGCDFFGKAATKFYCSRCFEKNLPNIFDSADDSFLAAEPSGGTSNNLRPNSGLKFEPPGGSEDDKERPKCTNCQDFYANPEYGQLCSTCFKEKTKNETNREKRRDDLPPIRESEIYHNKDREYRAQKDRERERNGYHHYDIPLPQQERGSSGREGLNPLDDVTKRGGYDPIQGEKRDRYKDSKRDDIPPVGGREGPRICILCSPDEPIVRMNTICEEHAKKCRLMMGNPPRPSSPLRIYEDIDSSHHAKECETKGCFNYATESCNGYCRACYRRKFNDNDRRSNSPLPKAKILCRTAGCSFHAVPSLNDYCDDCYEKQRRDRERREERPGPREQQQPKAKILCRTAGCSFHAVPSLNDYCENCYGKQPNKERERRHCDYDRSCRHCCNARATYNDLCERCFDERNYGTGRPPLPPSDRRYQERPYPPPHSRQYDDGTEGFFNRRASEPQLASLDRPPESRNPKLDRLRSLSQEDERDIDRDRERGSDHYYSNYRDIPRDRGGNYDHRYQDSEMRDV